jgi:protease-4
VSVDGFGTSRLSGQFSPVMELGEEGRRLLDISVRSAYDVFIGKVVEHRDMTREQVDQLARGRVWIGADAVELGLVDRLGTLDDALASAAERAGLPDESWDVVYVRDEPSPLEQFLLRYLQLLERLFAGTGMAGGPASWLQQRVMPLIDSIADFERWNDPRGIYFHCMCEVTG